MPSLVPVPSHKDLSEIYMIPGRNRSGIVNLGNTCFMNAAVQCLSATLSLTKFFLSQSFRNDLNTHKKEFTMLVDYYRVLEGLWEKNQTIKPVSFKRTLSKFYQQFQGCRQHDSHEVLTFIIEMLHQAISYKVNIGSKGTIENYLDQMEVNAIKTWNTCFKLGYSFIVEMLYGQHHSCTVCNLCHKSVHRYDPFSVIVLPIHNLTNLTDALTQFVSTETLDDDNRWRCEHCHELTNANKTLAFWRLPKTLIITLKRFNSRSNGSQYKLQHHIDFPLDDLDMTPYLSTCLSQDDSTHLYELYAVNCHSGGTNGGHYFACCKNLDGNWYIHNDAGDPAHSKIQPRKVINSKAYILFYRKK